MHITENQFVEEIRPSIISEGKNALLVFSASWCGPCQELHERLDDIYNSTNHNLTVCEFDVDECEAIVDEYEIRNMPTLVVYRNGNIEDIINRAISHTDLEELIEDLEE